MTTKQLLIEARETLVKVEELERKALDRVHSANAAFTLAELTTRNQRWRVSQLEKQLKEEGDES